MKEKNALRNLKVEEILNTLCVRPNDFHETSSKWSSASYIKNSL